MITDKLASAEGGIMESSSILMLVPDQGTTPEPVRLRIHIPVEGS
jgi:hypothetical protein